MILAVIVLLLCALLRVVYSPWFQRDLSATLLARINSGGDLTVSLDDFRLSFPLGLDVDGLCVVQRGDTLVAASHIDTSVALLPLLEGTAELRSLTLDDARFRLGQPDSSLCMKFSAGGLTLGRTAVSLSDSTAAAQSLPVTVRLGRLGLRDFGCSMSLLPAIDSLGIFIADGSLSGGLIDLGGQQIELGRFSADRLAATFMSPDSATLASLPPQPADTVASSPWTVTVDTIAIRASKALYTTRGVKPLPGLDFAYIEADSLDLDVNGFYNRASALRLPLHLSAVERCGVQLTASGLFALDSAAMTLDSLRVTTPLTSLTASMTMGLGSIASDPSLPLDLDASGGIGVGDLRRMFPAFMPYLITLPACRQLKTDISVHGTAGNLSVDKAYIALDGCADVNARGRLSNLASPSALSGDISLSGHVMDVRRIKDSLLGPVVSKSVDIPRMALNGHVVLRGASVDGRVKVTTGAGTLALDGKWNSHRADYTAALDIDDFPVASFMPALGADCASASLRADGHGYNPFVTDFNANASLDVKSITYRDYTYRGISLSASASGGNCSLSLASGNPDLDLSFTASGRLAPQPFEWSFALDGREIDLYALHLSDAEGVMSFDVTGRGSFDTETRAIDASVDLHRFGLSRPLGKMAVADVNARLSSTDTLTALTVDNRDLSARFESAAPLDSVLSRFSAASDVLAAQYRRSLLNVDELQRALPSFGFTVNAGSDNAINDVLRPSKTAFRRLSLSMANDSVFTLDSHLTGLVSGTAKIDTIAFDIDQHGEFMVFDARVGNRPGTFDSWAHVNLGGYVGHNEVGLRLNQSDIAGRQGFDMGMNVTVEDSVATLRLVPVNQVIGYQPWTVNKDNYISYDLATRRVGANLVMTGGKSRLDIMTDSVGEPEPREDLVIRLTDINLADWVAINPFAPPVRGSVNADVRLHHNGSDLNGVGDIALDDFYYGKERVASLKLDFDVKTRPGGTLYAKSDVYVDGFKTMTVSGALNDSIADTPFDLDFSMIRFPLATVNPFLPPRMARLRGMLNGSMRISGDKDSPVLNGHLDFDSTAVSLALTGTEYVFSSERIPVVDNMVTFDRFTVKGVNANPLFIDGTVDLSSLSSPQLDLSLKADNMQIVNSSRARKGADIYGKAFISLDTKVHGNLGLLFVNADLRINPPTNVTYVIPDAVNAIASRSAGDMVRFVNFTDTAAVIMADSIAASSTALILDATLTVENGTTIGVNLSSDGKNRAQIEADGSLNFTMSPLSDGRMTGRLDINAGYVRYSPPFMSEKNFAFRQGSYVAFNGDVMNPVLNIHAFDGIKANVTQSGQNSRLVDFDVILNVTGSLDRLDVVFDLTTDDDVTVANELQSMSPDQRANQAMNMLLYGMYTGPGTKADASISGNALYSFLESQINSWAANNIKGVDISFGIDQYDRTVDGTASQTTSYSYQVSKSLFNDRFKIVIGGNYSTDANADENFSQNLVNDISFDYYLNRSHTMYVRIFRHTGYESILEGEITQTGVGFVYRRKLNRLADMFKFLKPRSKNK